MITTLRASEKIKSGDTLKYNKNLLNDHYTRGYSPRMNSPPFTSPLPTCQRDLSLLIDARD